MLSYVKQGWKSVLRLKSVLFILFVYQWAWGMFIYTHIKSVVIPALQRYPESDLSPASAYLYWAESHFRIMKTDMALQYLWIPLVILAIRMLIAPFINSGLYHTIQCTEGSRREFLAGIKRLIKPFALLYALQMLLTLVPIYWLLAVSKDAFATHYSYESIMTAVAPYLVGYFLYVYIIKIIFVYIQLAIAANSRLSVSIQTLARHFLTILGLAAMIWIAAGAVSAVVISASMVWAGFLAVALHQLFYFVKVIFRVWEITTQYHYWNTKTGTA
jgi:hypothetical protein